MFKQKDLQLMIMLLLGCSGYLHRASTAGPSGRGGWVLWACHADELHLLLLCTFAPRYWLAHGKASEFWWVLCRWRCFHFLIFAQKGKFAFGCPRA